MGPNWAVDESGQCDLAFAMWLISFKVLLNAKEHHLEWFSNIPPGNRYPLKPKKLLTKFNCLATSQESQSCIFSVNI